MRGRRPTESPSRARDAGRAEFGITDIGAEPVKGAPKLGRRPGGGAWLPATRKWWSVWQRAPQASQFQETDWQTLEMLAPLVDAYFRDPTSARWSEIKQTHAKLGATVADRMQLRMRIGAKVPAEPAPEEGDGKRKARPQKGDPRRLHVVDGSSEASA